eukprot:scpid78356/ scgid16223/ 
MRKWLQPAVTKSSTATAAVVAGSGGTQQSKALKWTMGEQPNWIGVDQPGELPHGLLDDLLTDGVCKSLITRGYAIAPLTDDVTTSAVAMDAAMRAFCARSEDDKVAFVRMSGGGDAARTGDASNRGDAGSCAPGADADEAPVRHSPNEYHGFARVEGLKEQFMIRIGGDGTDLLYPGAYPDPDTGDASPDFGVSSVALYQTLDQLCRDHLRQVAGQLAVDESKLDSILDPVACLAACPRQVNNSTAAAGNPSSPVATLPSQSASDAAEPGSVPEIPPLLAPAAAAGTTTIAAASATGTATAAAGTTATEARATATAATATAAAAASAAGVGSVVVTDYHVPHYISSSLLDVFHYYPRAKTHCQQPEHNAPKRHLNNHLSHTDSGIITAVLSSAEPGLEVYDQLLDKWICLEQLIYDKHGDSEATGDDDGRAPGRGVFARYVMTFLGDSCIYLSAKGVQPCLHRVSCSRPDRRRFSYVFKMRTRAEATAPRYQEDYVLADIQHKALLAAGQQSP